MEKSRKNRAIHFLLLLLNVRRLMSVKLVLGSQSEYVSASKTGGYSIFDSLDSMLFVSIGLGSTVELFSVIGPFKLLPAIGLPNSIGEKAS